MSSVSKPLPVALLFLCLDVQTSSLALPPPCSPPIQTCVLWGRAWALKALPCQGDRGENKMARLTKGPVSRPSLAIVLCRACRRTWDEWVPPPLQEPNRKSKFSRRMGRAQSYPPLGLAERRVQKEFWQDQRRLMQWIVFLLLASMAHTKLSVCLSVCLSLCLSFWKDTFNAQCIILETFFLCGGCWPSDTQLCHRMQLLSLIN